MKNKYLLPRMLVLLTLMSLLSLCVAIFGIVNALKITVLLVVPILIFLIGSYFLGKRLQTKGDYSNTLAIAMPALACFAFSFLGMMFDPKNKTPLGLNTFLFSGAAGIAVLLLELLTIYFLKLLRKR